MVPLGGCGNSSSSHASSTPAGTRSGSAPLATSAAANTRSATSTRAAAGPVTGRPASAGSKTGRSATSRSAGSRSATAPGGATGQSATAAAAQLTTYQTSSAGVSNARLPATFKIGAGGRLSPSTVYAPAGIPVELTVISGDGRRHRVVVRTPAAHVLPVPANGRVSVLLRGLKAGRYVLLVDGVARGALQVGGAPGP
jgi:hypothetical protein